MPQQPTRQPVRVIIAALLLVISLAGCYTNPGPAGLTPIPTLAAQPTLIAAAGVTPAAPSAAVTPGATGQPVAGATPGAGAAGTPGAGSGAASGSAQGDPQEGQQLFAVNCTPCHGADAGGSPIAPALKNNSFVKAGPDSAIFQTIAGGRPGTAMPAWSQAKGGKLSDAQINSLIAYLKTLQQ